MSEPLIATGSDGFLQVYVSAVADPGCFWVQVGVVLFFTAKKIEEILVLNLIHLSFSQY